MSTSRPTNQTYKDFSEALRELMRVRHFSFPKLAREIDRKLSTTYVHNLASGKSKPTKENIETIAKGLKVDPAYFKEYRQHEAKKRIDADSRLADLVLDDRAVELMIDFIALDEDEKNEVENCVRELLAKYATSVDK